MKKTLKIIGVIALFIIIIYSAYPFVYNEYIKILIKLEEKRIENCKKYEFVLDDEYKVSIYYKPDLRDKSVSTSYNIDFKNNTVEICRESINHMPIKYNESVVWGENKAKLEQLRSEQYNREVIELDDSRKRKLEDLIATVLSNNKTVEEYNEEHKIKSPYKLTNPSTYLVSTINKTKVVMDNKEQINLFFELIGKEKTIFD